MEEQAQGGGKAAHVEASKGGDKPHGREGKGPVVWKEHPEERGKAYNWDQFHHFFHVRKYNDAWIRREWDKSIEVPQRCDEKVWRDPH